jgi:excisionase family DNA binding protein
VTLADLEERGILAISVPEAARVLGIGRNTAYVAARSGELPSVKIGGRVVVPVRRLRALLDGTKGDA